MSRLTVGVGCDDLEPCVEDHVDERAILATDLDLVRRSPSPASESTTVPPPTSSRAASVARSSVRPSAAPRGLCSGDRDTAADREHPGDHGARHEHLPVLLHERTPPRSWSSASSPGRPERPLKRHVAGSRTSKRAPPTGPSVTTTVPPCSAAISRTIDRPRPLPPTSRSRASSSRTNRSNTRSALGGRDADAVVVDRDDHRPSLRRSSIATSNAHAGRRSRRGCATPARAGRGRPRAGRPSTRSAMTRWLVIARSRAASSWTRSSRSTGPGRELQRPLVDPSQEQQVVDDPLEAERLLVRRRRRASADRSGPDGASASSACWRIEATGERSSCEASDTNRRSRSRPASSRSSIRFIVAARRAISSSPPGSGTRRSSSRPRSRRPRRGSPRPARALARRAAT